MLKVKFKNEIEMDLKNQIMNFTHIDFGKIRIIVTDNEPWFVGKDIAKILGYTDTTQAIRKHVDKDDKRMRQIDAPLGGPQNTTVINESGLYSLIFGSKLKTAKKFKKWVTKDVLPSIRQYGAYINPMHPTIRELSKEIRNDCESAIHSLSIYARKYGVSKDKLFAILTNMANEIVGIKSGERDKADSWQLITLIRIESSIARVVHYGIENGKSLIDIVDACEMYIKDDLNKFNLRIN